MTSADLAIWHRARSSAARLQPDLSRAVLAAFATIKAQMSDADFVHLIQSGELERFIADLAGVASFAALVDRAFLKVRVRLRVATESAFRSAVTELPKAGKVDGVIAVQFDYLSPNVVKAIRQLDTKVVQSLSDDVSQSLRVAVEAGLQQGEGPRSIARGLRSVIGMSPTQTANAIKYEAKLVASGKYTDEQIARLVGLYQRKAIALNAETVSRTASLDAMKLGQALSWQDAIDRGIVSESSLVKRWVGVMDDRERPEHVAMEGDTVAFSEPYSNGQMIPGEDEYNCRCISKVYVA